MWTSKTTINLYESKCASKETSTKESKPAEVTKKTKMSKYRDIFEDAGFTVEEETDTTLKGTSKDGYKWSVTVEDVEPSTMKKDFDDLDKALKEVRKTVTSSMDELFRSMNNLFHK